MNYGRHPRERAGVGLFAGEKGIAGSFIARFFVVKETKRFFLLFGLSRQL